MSSLLDALYTQADEFIAIRRDIHSEPEMAFEEHRTSELVANALASYGYVVHRGLGDTGVVGQLKRGDGTKSVGLRADMDALPILESNSFGYASKRRGFMHACGHDGHTAMLLAAAKYIAKSARFSGTLNLIFQPAEEGAGGAKRMMDEGLFERFPCDAIFAIHNMPGLAQGHFHVRPGATMASSANVTITIKGVGGHGALPHFARDVVVAASSTVMALQTVIARGIDPQKTGVVTVGAIHAGTANNVIPQEATLLLSVRALDRDTNAVIEARIREVVELQAKSFGCTATIDYQHNYPVLVNTEAEARFAYEKSRAIWSAPTKPCGTPPRSPRARISPICSKSFRAATSSSATVTAKAPAHAWCTTPATTSTMTTSRCGRRFGSLLRSGFWLKSTSYWSYFGRCRKPSRRLRRSLTAVATLA